ncbi:hypothetical protein PM082_000176 [Marasmius tenuissimus]|nr:hypothetical protein PM082_000176 [Marasmius tenuissimus]
MRLLLPILVHSFPRLMYISFATRISPQCIRFVLYCRLLLLTFGLSFGSVPKLSSFGYFLIVTKYTHIWRQFPGPFIPILLYLIAVERAARNSLPHLCTHPPIHTNRMYCFGHLELCSTAGSSGGSVCPQLRRLYTAEDDILKRATWSVTLSYPVRSQISPLRACFPRFDSSKYVPCPIGANELLGFGVELTTDGRHRVRDGLDSVAAVARSKFEPRII